MCAAHVAQLVGGLVCGAWVAQVDMQLWLANYLNPVVDCLKDILMLEVIILCSSSGI